MFQALGIFSGLLTAISYVPYIRDIVKREADGAGLSSTWLTTGLYISKSAKPARTAWFIWTLAATIAFFTQRQLGSSSSLWFTGADACGCAVVFLLSLKYGYGGFMKRDVFGLIIVAASVVAWRVMDAPFYALLLAIAAEAVSAALTIWKTIEHPNNETYPAWILQCIAGLLAVVSVGTLNASQVAYAGYEFLFTGAIMASIFFGRLHRSKWANVE